MESSKTLIISPLTGSHNVKYLYSINKNDVINGYANSFSTDVKRFFDGIHEIKIYSCLDTGYSFYYPFNIEGDGNFYYSLSKFEWYYMPWKWEHQKAFDLIESDKKVLEIGCASGSFIEKLKTKSVLGVGLELNENAVLKGKTIGLDIRLETIQNHSIEHKNFYDFVCAFEVLEHISDVKSFLKASVECLKPGGFLVVAVPNNDSFIKFSKFDNYLNMPPHHMGLWRKKSLINLSKLFNLTTVKVFYEPLQKYHYKWFTEILNRKVQRYIRGSFMNRQYLCKRYFLILQTIMFNLLKFVYKRKGHTILVVYQKDC